VRYSLCDTPVSQFITTKGCIIQGVMLNESEINRIWCPEHKKMEQVYSFDREISLRGRPTKLETELAKMLREGKQE